MAKINVLVFPAGEINSIELHDALSTCVNIELYGASSIDRHGEYVFKNYIPNVPMINNPDFLEKFNTIIKDKKIDIVFPTHDTVSEFFANNINKLCTKIICANQKTSQICRDKRKTFDLFYNDDFCPKIFNDFKNLPVFIKPNKGQGSIGAKLIQNKKDIPFNIDINEYVICEYLPGEEYTVDCFTNRNGRLQAILPRSRKRILAGVCVSGQNEKLTDEIKKIADKINEKLCFNGLWYFQIKKDINNKFKLLEISTRCAGTMCLSRALGVNLPLLSVYDALGYNVEVFENLYNVKMDRTLISRYKINYDYKTVYFDFDDTLIIEGKVHLPAVWFLYQCKNLCKKVILLTKHEKEIYKSLEYYCIDKNLFSEIIHIAPDDNKADYINPDGAIFIDNAYQERYQVYKKYNIPVFDVDGIEVLMDWRC